MAIPPEREQWETERHNSSSNTTEAGVSSDETEVNWSMIDVSERRELQRIATAFSQRRPSLATAPEGSTALDRIATLGDDDPKLRPDHPDFDLARWLKRLVGELQDNGVTLKRSGIVYENLQVSGTGAALQLQQTVGSWLTSPLRLGELFSFGAKEPKRILQGFDGVLQAGELLVVLGRPGSGCSTLLKTMCGELEGLTVDDKSTIHYNGIPQKTMMKEFKGETTYNQEVSIVVPTDLLKLRY
jgi:ATP-binding cassette subfamily G (WHITE) protein 2 (PDR)